MFRNFQNFCRLIKISYVLTKHLYPFAYKLKKNFPVLSTFFSAFSFTRKKRHKIGQNLANAFEELGPIFIKLGQSLSTRADIIGEEIAYDLGRLRDKTKPFCHKQVIKIIEEELGGALGEFYSEFDVISVASASIAQIHKAINIYGQQVAVKILRPNIEELFARDLKLFYYLAHKINIYYPELRRLKLIEILDNFSFCIKMEMDLRLEAAACDELKNNLKDDNTLYIPYIDWKHTSQKVLTLEWIDGISIDNKEALINAGHNLDYLAANISICFFNQAFRDGFFHADMHQGNIIVNHAGQVVLVDFGIMGRLNYDTRIFLAEILKGFIEEDYMHVAKMHFTAGYVPKNQSIESFAQACRSIGKPIVGLPANKISVAKLLAQLFKITEDFQMETQPQLLLLQKTLVLIEGVGSHLDHNVNMWLLAEPWIKEWGIKNLGFEAKIIKFIKNIVDLTNNKIHEHTDQNFQKHSHTNITATAQTDSKKLQRNNWFLKAVVLILVLYIMYFKII